MFLSWSIAAAVAVVASTNPNVKELAAVAMVTILVTAMEMLHDLHLPWLMVASHPV